MRRFPPFAQRRSVGSNRPKPDQARVKAAYEFTAQPKLGNGRGALERWPRKQALTIGRGAGTEQRREVGLSHVIERIADRNVCERHPPRHQEVTTLQPLLE